MKLSSVHIILKWVLLFIPNLRPEIKVHRLVFPLDTCCFILLSLSTSLLSLSLLHFVFTFLFPVSPVKQGKHEHHHGQHHGSDFLQTMALFRLRFSSGKFFPWFLTPLVRCCVCFCLYKVGHFSFSSLLNSLSLFLFFLQADSFVKSFGSGLKWFHSIFGFKSTQPRHLHLNSISFFSPFPQLLFDSLFSCSRSIFVIVSDACIIIWWVVFMLGSCGSSSFIYLIIFGLIELVIESETVGVIAIRFSKLQKLNWTDHKN